MKFIYVGIVIKRQIKARDAYLFNRGRLLGPTNNRRFNPTLGDQGLR
jgi:hypothetical protein